MTRAAFLAERPNASTLRSINYSPAAEQIWRRHPPSRVERLRGLTSRFASSFGNVFTRVDADHALGVQLLSQVDMFAAEPIGRWIRKDAMPFPHQHEIKRGDILIAGAGQLGETTLFGRGIVADARMAGAFVDGHAVQLGFDDPLGDVACYVYAYLISRLGLALIRATAYGTSVPGIRTDLLGDLPVLLPGPAIIGQIAALVREAVRDREIFAREIQLARRPIAKLPAMQEALAACGDRRAKIGVHVPSATTLSAWNYVSTGRALPILRGAWRARLGDVIPLNGLFNGLRFARIECEAPHGLELLSQRDIFLLRPVAQRVVDPGFERRFLFAPPGSLLIGGAGTLGEGEIFGRVSFVTAELSRFAITQHMLRVQPLAQHAPLVYAFLSTLVGRRLLRSTAVGTKILSMRADLLRALPLPEVDAATEGEITTRLSAAMRAKDAAERAEAAAIRLVEQEVLA